MREWRTRLQDWSRWEDWNVDYVAGRRSTKLIFARFASMRIVFVERGAGQWRQHRYINSDFK